METEPDENMQLIYTDEQIESQKAIVIIGASPIKEPIGALDKLNGKSINPQEIRFRKNMSYVWIPVNTENHKESNLEIGINWTGTAKLDYTELSNKIDLEYSLIVADLVSAEHSQNGDVTGLLQESDDQIAILNPGEYIDLKFNAPPPAEGMKRSFIFVSRGRYERIDEKNTESVLAERKANNNSSDDNPNKPTRYELSQNHPNPFNPVTTINYQLPPTAVGDNYVTIKVYDVLGKEVATLVNEYKSAGYYEVTFDASDLSSGVYFYKLVASSAEPLRAGNYVSVKKMLLAK